MNGTAESVAPGVLAPGMLHNDEVMDKISMPNKPVLTSGDKIAFSAILEGAAANPDLCTISNRYPWQARIAAGKLLQIARTNHLPIRVLSGRCHEGFYDQRLAEQLQLCKETGCSIRFLVWQKSAEGISPALIKLSESGVIELRVSGTDQFESSVPHFILIGDRAFRQEAGHPPFNKDTVFTEYEPQVPARIDFNDPATGKVLIGMFDNLWG